MWFGAAALGTIVVLAHERRLNPLWPAIAFAIAFTAIMFLTRAGSVSNLVGGLAGGVASYFFIRMLPEIISGVGKWFAVFLTLGVPVICVMVADRVTRFIALF